MKSLCFPFLVSLFLFIEKMPSQISSKQYFEDQASIENEHIAVHINNNVFSSPATLWFTAYLKSTLSRDIFNASLNLQVGLYDIKGNLLKQSVHYIEDGVATGSILLTEPVGTYFVKIQTNWMRNFKHSKPFIAQIEIINSSPNAVPPENSPYTVPDAIDLFPIESSIDMYVDALPINDLIISFEKLDSNNTEEQDYFLAIHNNVDLQITKLKIEEKTKVLKISKNQLTSGVHTILLLDKNQKKIQEQSIFHLPEFETEQQIALDFVTKKNDSIYVALTQLDQGLAPYQTSLVVKPSESKSTIKNSSLLVQEAFKHIWTSEKDSLFIPTDRKSLAALNKRLTLAKNLLDWNYLDLQDKEMTFIKERGFTISGSVRSWKKGHIGTISFYQRNVGQIVTTDILQDGTFTFTNSYLESGEDLNFSITVKGETISEPPVDISIEPKLWRDRLRIEQTIKAQNPTPTTPSEQARVTQARGINLDEVELRGTKKNKEELVRNDRLANTASLKGKKIKIEDTENYPLLSTYIRSLGFRVLIAADGSLIISSRRTFDPPPLVFMDGLFVNYSLNDESLKGIDEIFYDTTGASQSTGGVIHIYRQESGSVDSNVKAVVSLPSDEGYKKQQPYFQDTNTDRFDSFSRKYDTIYWNGKLTFDPDGIATIAFPSYGLDAAIIHIEGIDRYGNFFSQEEVLYFE